MRNSAVRRSASSRMRRGSASPSASVATPAAIAISITTRRSSIGVKPRTARAARSRCRHRRRRCRPVRRRRRAEHIDLAVHAGVQILILLAHGSFGSLSRVLAPVRRHRRALRLGDERLQTLLARRIAAVIQPIELERLLDRRDVVLRRGDARVVASPDYARHHQHREDADDHHHHHDLDEGEAPGTRFLMSADYAGQWRMRSAAWLRIATVLLAIILVASVTKWALTFSARARRPSRCARCPRVGSRPRRLRSTAPPSRVYWVPQDRPAISARSA